MSYEEILKTYKLCQSVYYATECMKRDRLYDLKIYRYYIEKAYSTYKYEDTNETVKILDMYHNYTDDYFNNKLLQYDKLKENKEIILQLIKKIINISHLECEEKLKNINILKYKQFHKNNLSKYRQLKNKFDDIEILCDSISNKAIEYNTKLQELCNISIDCKIIRGYYSAKYIEDINNEHLKIIKEYEELINSKIKKIVTN